MITHDVEQGSPEWLALRANYDTASEAPAMMGCSRYLSREELLRQKATGHTPEISATKQALFDRGHETEAAARAIVEELIGESLYPVTGVSEKHPRLLASFDGLTMAEDKGYEHKLWNEELAAQVRAKNLDPHYYWQLEQELLVSEAESIVFVTSDGTRDRFEWMEYRPVPGRAAQLIAGWKQFNEDRAAYRHAEPSPVLVAAPITALPALQLQFSGDIIIHSNLDTFREAVMARIASIKTDLKTDQDFVDAKATVRDLEDTARKARDTLDRFRKQNASAADVESTMATLLEHMDAKRLALDKTVKAKEKSRKTELQQEHADAFTKHVAALNTSLGRPYMPEIVVEWAEITKGMRSFDSMADKLKGALATAKLAANDRAEKIRANLTWLQQNASEHKTLFPDTATLVLMEHEAMTAICKNRITEHKDAEEKKRVAEKARTDGIEARIATIRGYLAKADGCTTLADLDALAQEFATDNQGDFAEYQAAANAAISASRARIAEVRATLRVQEAPAPAPAPQPSTVQAVAAALDAAPAAAPAARVGGGGGGYIARHAPAPATAFPAPAATKVQALATALGSEPSDAVKREAVIERLIVRLREMSLDELEEFEAILTEATAT
jgi:putative phage-type endonuclease